MKPFDFPECNCHFKAPSDLDESQCMTIAAFRGEVSNPNSSLDGCPVCVVAWQPSPLEIEMIKDGKPIFLSFVANGLPPHYPCMSFQEATNPA